MRAWILIGLLLFSVDSFSKNDSYVRVRVSTLPEKLQLSGLSLSFQGKKSKFMPVAIPRTSAVDIRYEQYKNRPSWVVRNKKSKKAVRYYGNPLAVSGEGMSIGAVRAPSRLLLFARPERKRVDAVAVVDIDQYLVGVLASEMPASWPLEALKAQAVASRSYALFQRRQARRKSFHLESDTKDQVFSLRKLASLSSGLKEKVHRAVQETRGMVLEQDQKLLRTYYHADCGGRAEEPHVVWRDGLYLETPRKDNYCPMGPHASWQKAVTPSALGAKIFGNASPVKKLKIIKKTKSGRAYKLWAENSSGQRRQILATSLRHRLGATKIKSTLFKVRKEGKHFHFKGKGFGHGVGLCQWGARWRAVKGEKFEEILAHYYPKARLTTIAKPMTVSQARQESSSAL